MAGRAKHSIGTLGRVFGLATVAIVLAGCAGQRATTQPGSSPGPTSRTVAAPTRAAHRGEHIAQIASSLVGTPYRYGGNHPAEGFDCSGLVFFTHRQANLKIPRTSRDQYRAAQPVTLREAQPGDLVFFRDQSKLSHVGIYLGGQRFVHAPSSGRAVSVARLDAPYYREHLVGLGRLY